MGFTVVVPKEFPLTLLACLIIGSECYVIGMVAVGKAREKYFSKEFMAQFDSKHGEAFPGQKAPAGGNPDCGDGRFSEELDYKSWVEFNSRMRVHANFVENLPVILTILTIAGLVLPKAAMYIGFLNAIARIVFTVLYI